MFESAGSSRQSPYEALTPAGVLAAALIAPPSAELLCALAKLDVNTLDSGLQVDLMVAWERVAAWVQGCQAPVVAVVGYVAFAAATESMKEGGHSMEMPYRASHAEIGCALRLSERGGQHRLDMSRMIAVELPAVHAALLLGDISYWHAVAIAETAQEIDDPAERAWVAAKVLPKARKQTVSDLRRRLRQLLLQVNPKTAARRHAEAVAERGVDWFPLPDGMAELRLTATASDVKAVFNTVDAMARSMPKKDADGLRIPIDARRADAMVAMIAGTSGGALVNTANTANTGGTDSPASTDGTGGLARRLPADVQVTMDIATALGLADNPGELAGYGPIPAPLARSLAADGKWRRLICDPLTGALIDLGTTVYRPNAELERFIKSRDARCIFPVCNQPAYRCEIDHTKPFRPDDPATGTDRCNLGCLCKYHHDLKHAAGWQLHRDSDDHTATWISTTGHHYGTAHHDYRSIDVPIAPGSSESSKQVVEYQVVDHVEIRWKDFQYLLPDEDDGQSDWGSFVRDHMNPPDPADSEPAYEPHESYDFESDDGGAQALAAERCG